MKTTIKDNKVTISHNGKSVVVELVGGELIIMNNGIVQANGYALNIPDWAEWVAMDNDGEIFVFDSEPENVGGCFYHQAGRYRCEVSPFLFSNLTYENSPQKIER